MLSDFAEKKETFFDLEKQHFSMSKKSLFFKGVNPYFCQKNANFIFNLNLIKISLEIMLSHFAEKKRNVFDYKKQNFSKFKKTHFFKGVNPCFWSKNAIFLNLFRFGQNKSRNNA